MSSQNNTKWLQLRARFHERLQRELAQLQTYLPSTINLRTEEDYQALLHQAHKLAGIGGVFGYDEISTCSLALEACIMQRQNTQDINTALQTLIATISAILQNDSPVSPV